MISRRALAHALGMQTASLAREGRRGKGPARPIAFSPTHIVFEEAEVAVWLRARGLRWTGRDVEPLEGDESPAPPAAPGGAP